MSEIAEILLDIEAVTFNAKKPYVYTSGMKSPIYCDIRKIQSYPTEREVVVQELISVVGAEYDWREIDVVSGTATAGMPLASWLADRLHKPMIYVRSGKKKHGLGNQIEGVVREDQSVLIVEDIISSGKSSLSNVNAVREVGAIVAGCITVAHYDLTEAHDRFKKAEVRVERLVSMKDVVTVAHERGLLDDDDVVVIEDWLDDPWGWAKRQGFDD